MGIQRITLVEGSFIIHFDGVEKSMDDFFAKAPTLEELEEI